MFLGIEIGGTKLQIVMADAGGEITRRWRGTVDQKLGGTGICRQIESALATLVSESKTAVVSAGVGFGGPVDSHTGQICKSHQIDGWENFPIRDWLADLLKRPVIVDNDANVGALGEATHGAGVGADPVFYITLGSGVGGGLVAGGKIFHGQPPGEAEFGHLHLDRDGTIVESRCSGWAVDARIRKLVQAEPSSQLARLIDKKVPGGEARFLVPALQVDDPLATWLLHEICTDLAFAISHVVHLVHPQTIVLGGGLSLVGEPLQSGIEKQLPDFVMQAFWPPPAVRLAKLGEDAVPVGAVELARLLI